MACGILFLQPGITPGPSAVTAPCPNHWTSREFPKPAFFLLIHHSSYTNDWCNLKIKSCLPLTKKLLKYFPIGIGKLILILAYKALPNLSPYLSAFCLDILILASRLRSHWSLSCYQVLLSSQGFLPVLFLCLVQLCSSLRSQIKSPLSGNFLVVQ